MILTCTLILNRYPAWYDLGWRRGWGAERVTIHLLDISKVKTASYIPYIIISSSCLIIRKLLEKRKHFQYLFLHGTILRGFPYIWYLWSIEFFQHCPIVSIVILNSILSYLIAYILFCILTGSTAIESPSHYDDNELCWSPLIWWPRPLYIIHVLNGLQLIKEDKMGQVSNPNSNWYNRERKFLNINLKIKIIPPPR